MTEHLFASKDGAVVQVARGEAGAAIINISSKPAKVKLETTLPTGEYTDAVHGYTFKVKNGFVEGRVEALSSYILYAK